MTKENTNTLDLLAEVHNKQYGFALHDRITAHLKTHGYVEDSAGDMVRSQSLVMRDRAGEYIGFETLRRFKDMSAEEPVRVVVNITGGLMQGASANIKGVEVYCVDYDTDGCTPEEMIEVDDSEVRFGWDTADFEPDFVTEVSQEINERKDDGHISE